MVTTTKITTLTPETINTSTPTIDHTNTKILTNPYSYNKEIIHPEIYTKKRKIVSQEKIEDTALKMTQKLAKLNFRDTGLATQHKTKKQNYCSRHVLQNRTIRSLKHICRKLQKQRCN